MPSKGELECYAGHYLLWKKCIDINEPILLTMLLILWLQRN
ncbi:glycosyltransferase family 25 protein [Marinomonas flavescens]